MADLKYGEIAGQAYSSPTEKINPSSRTDIKCVFDKLTFAGGDVAKTKEGIWFSDIPRGARILELDVSMSAIFDALNTTVDFEVRIDGSDGSQQVLRTISVEAVLANARSVLIWSCQKSILMEILFPISWFWAQQQTLILHVTSPQVQVQFSFC